MALGTLAAVLLVVVLGGSEHEPFRSKFAGGDPDAAQAASSETTPGEGPVGGWEAYRSTQRTYPADVIPPAVVGNAEATFEQIAAQDGKTGDPGSKGHQWNFYGPTQNASQPGVTSFSGAANTTASRTTALVVDPSCNASRCRISAGVSGGGVWRTDNAMASNPDWKQLHPGDLDQNSVGTLVLDSTDKKGNTLYLGTGEGHRCSSGCEAGVGIYKSTDAGEHWTKLADACVSNATYTCVNSADAFLGRAINSIVIDPRNDNHILVGSAQAVRGLSHVIGNGGQTRLEPGANAPASTSRPTAARRSPRSGTGTAPARSGSPTSGSTRSTPTSSTQLRSTRACGGGTPGQRRRRSARSSRRSSARVRGSTGRCLP